MLADIATNVFTVQEHREYWIALLGAESRYSQDARSVTGAVGIGQLILTYRNDFAAACGLGEMNKSDLSDTYTNAYLSACYFRQQIEKTGSIPLALVAYNAGINSNDLKRTKQGKAPSHEPSGYSLRVWHLHTATTSKECKE
jgi:soluble lytic murein transglycosylase-like protein